MIIVTKPGVGLLVWHPAVASMTTTAASTLRMGDFAQDDGAGGSGGGGEVPGQAVPGEPGEEGEGDGFFRL